MEQNTPKHSTSDEVTIIEIIRYIWNARRLILKITGVFMVLGLVYALTSQVKYTAEAQLLPESEESAGGASALLRQFGGLGGLTLPLGEGSDAIRPDLYPFVISSTPFFLELMKEDIHFETDNGFEKMTVFTYMVDHTSSFWGVVGKYTIKLPFTVLGWIRSKDKDEIPGQASVNIPKMSEEQYEVKKGLVDLLTSDIDLKTGIISISGTFPDPKVAAQITQFAVEYIAEYITQYRTEKAQKTLEFINLRYNEKELIYKKAQEDLALFRDANQNVQSASLQAEEQRLLHQYTLAFNVYNGLAQQLEQARIKVQEETPVIKILEPVQVPVKRSEPKRAIIMIISVFIGGFIAVGFVFGKIVWENIKDQL